MIKNLFLFTKIFFYVFIIFFFLFYLIFIFEKNILVLKFQLSLKDINTSIYYLDAKHSKNKQGILINLSKELEKDFSENILYILNNFKFIEINSDKYKFLYVFYVSKNNSKDILADKINKISSLVLISKYFNLSEEIIYPFLNLENNLDKNNLLIKYDVNSFEILKIIDIFTNLILSKFYLFFLLVSIVVIYIRY